MSEPSRAVDRFGLTYDECLRFQAERLLQWQGRVMPTVFLPVKAYCERTNLAAQSPSEKHRVYRGGDIDALIREWPEINEHTFVPKDPSAPPASVVNSDPYSLV